MSLHFRECVCFLHTKVLVFSRPTELCPDPAWVLNMKITMGYRPRQWGECLQCERWRDDRETWRCYIAHKSGGKGTSPGTQSDSRNESQASVRSCFGATVANLCFCWKNAGVSSGSVSARILISFMRSLASWTNYLPKASSTNTITLSAKVLTRIWKNRQTISNRKENVTLKYSGRQKELESHTTGKRFIWSVFLMHE